MTVTSRLPIESRPTYGWLMILVAVLAAGGVGGALWWRHRQADIADARAWTVIGPPCPAVDRATFLAQPYEARQAFETDGIRWARSSAVVECQTIRSDGGVGGEVYPVCQFSSPRALQITTAKGDFYFVPPLGQKATVTVRGGVASCVLGASVDFRN
jgi:hypothetical protein